MIEPIALPRGAVLLEEAAEGARSFAVGFWFPLGSRHEASSERGFVHFVEHMVFKGSARRSAEDFAREIDRVGGYLNAFTERDCLCFHCAVPAAHWRLALDVLADLVFGAVFPAAEFEREKSVIVSEILAAGDDPEEASHDALAARIWAGDPISLKIAGETEDIERTSREALYEFYRRRVRPEHLIVSVSGPIPAGEVALELDRLFAALPAENGANQTYPVDTLPPFKAINEYLTASIAQVYLHEAVQMAAPPLPDDYYVFSVLNGALGESMSSRLFQDLRERRGLCYSVYSSFSVDRGMGLWFASASSSVRLFPKLLEGLDRQLERLAGGGDGSMTEEEVAESVSRLAGSFDLALEDPDYRMRRLARQMINEGIVLEAGEAREKMLRVTKAEVDELAHRLFTGVARARFAYGRKSAAVERAMLAGGVASAGLGRG
jgi:predicted Zn-dependent peptidase